MAPIDRLPDPCLVALFRAMTPADQMTARDVCARWDDLVLYSVRKTQSLTLFIGELDDYDMAHWISRYSPAITSRVLPMLSLKAKPATKPGAESGGRRQFIGPVNRLNPWNILMYNELDEDIIEKILSTFVNIKALQIGINQAPSSVCFHLANLLNELSDQLIYLAVHKDNCADDDDDLLNAINGLTALKTLGLYFEDDDEIDLPIIGRLEALSICLSEEDDLEALLTEYATDTLKTIEYICWGNDETIQNLAGLIAEELRSRFIRIHHLDALPLTDLPTICEHFRGLTMLCIHPEPMSIRRLFQHLAKLTALVFLDLSFDFIALQPDTKPHLGLLEQLPSLRALQLAISFQTHKQLEQLRLPWTAPNLEAFELVLRAHSECTYCEIEDYDDESILKNLDSVRRCFGAIFGHLKNGCSRLTVMLHNFEHLLGIGANLALMQVEDEEKEPPTIAAIHS